MHRHGRFRYGPRLFRPRRPWRGVFWLFLLAFLFMGGRWWPGILLLIVFASLFGSIFRDTTQPRIPEQPPVQVPMPPATLAGSIHRADLLPATCPHCGGPVHSHEVKWTAAQSAACPYCGSNLPMKKL